MSPPAPEALLPLCEALIASAFRTHPSSTIVGSEEFDALVRAVRSHLTEGSPPDTPLAWAQDPIKGRWHRVVSVVSGTSACGQELHGTPILWARGLRCHTRRLDDKREVRGDIVYITEVHEKLGPWEVIPYSERLATIAMIDYVQRSRA